jgi:4-amino-4-deoxy-L-arabinose transferase-like glycosyltransferase
MHRLHSILILCVAIVLIALSFNARPIGYLHSWNQITTLVHVSALTRDLNMWNRPYDVVTRLPDPPKKLSTAEPFDDFRIYEEPPLYHILSSLLARLSGFSPENSSRLISVGFWTIGAVGMYALGTLGGQALVPIISVLLYCCSFPFAYYGAAIMSDIAMTSMWIWSLVYVGRREKDGRFANTLVALFCAGLSGLFKSYGVLAILPPVALEAWRLLRRAPGARFSELSWATIAATLAALPTLTWHSYALLQPGHQEFQSHSLGLKLNTLTSLAFLNTLQKGYFRYLSYAPGVVALLGSVALVRAKRLSAIPLTIWIACGTAALFIVATADKLAHHDYYLLMPAIPVFIIAATIVSYALAFVPTRIQTAALAALILTMAVPSFSNLRKALKEHADVIPCAELVAAHTQPSELLAAYADVTRYNSIPYYAQRLAVRVEDTQFPVQRYRDVGASYLVVDLPPLQNEQFGSWLSKQKVSAAIASVNSADYKGLPRVCTLYRLTQE